MMAIDYVNKNLYVFLAYFNQAETADNAYLANGSIIHLYEEVKMAHKNSKIL